MLEPIDEKDLDLESKFNEKPTGGSGPDKPLEAVASASPEKNVERKEGTVEKEAAYAKILSKVKSPAPALPHDEVKSDASLAGQEADVEGRVKRLVDLAMQKGVVHAVQVARHLDDNYVLDELHDKLVADELHEALMKKGLIKEI